MSYAIIRNEKLTRAESYGAYVHNDRKAKNHSNKDIDPTRTHLNFYCKENETWIYVKFLDTFFENFFIYMRPLSLLHYILNLYWYKWYTELLTSPFTPIQI